MNAQNTTGSEDRALQAISDHEDGPKVIDAVTRLDRLIIEATAELAELRDKVRELNNTILEKNETISDKNDQIEALERTIYSLSP